MGTREPRWFCAQIGAREHYSVPRILHRSGRLAALYTDFWAGPVVRGVAARLNAKTFHSLAGRFHPDLAGAPVISWNSLSLFREARRRQQKSAAAGYLHFAAIGREFAVRVRESLKQRDDLEPGSIFFSYDTGALEAMEWCRDRGVRCVLNQMDPGRVEAECIQAEERRWPGWSPSPLQIPTEYFARREQEWALADRIVVNSAFCREALLRQGVPREKLLVIPLCFESPVLTGTEAVDPESSQPLRVLFLGQVILRKGIQYLLEAAKLLQDENIQFDVVGPVGISDAALKTAPPNLKFHGRATRSEAAGWYRRSDVFVLPTLSDGFAITQLEAMSHGLPVVTTPNCGAVVSEGADGFVVPAADAPALAAALRRYTTDRDLAARQRGAALAKARQFSLDRLGAELQSLERALAN